MEFHVHHLFGAGALLARHGAATHRKRIAGRPRTFVWSFSTGACSTSISPPLSLPPAGMSSSDVATIEILHKNVLKHDK